MYESKSNRSKHTSTIGQEGTKKCCSVVRKLTIVFAADTVAVAPIRRTGVQHKDDTYILYTYTCIYYV